jgi:uncharacterized membrane protein YhaH (DUF805 family)
MQLPFSFRGQIRPLAYAAASLTVFLSQHLVVWIAFQALGKRLPIDVEFCLVPLRKLAALPDPPSAVLLSALAYLVLAAWVLAALAFRRAANAAISEWIAAPAMAPFVQIPVILLLCCFPPRPTRLVPTTAGSDAIKPPWAAASQGAVVGIGLVLAAVATSTLVFGGYGFGLFVVSPFIIGALTAYFANRSGDIGGGRTAKLVVAATALGGIALIVAALEGAVCLVLAAPLGIGLALVGGESGRTAALHTRQTPRQTLSVVATLPVVFAIEALFPLSTNFDTVQSVAVAAPAGAVWQTLLHMGPIEAPPALPFRLGVAFPLGGDVIGEGVGATRRGEFSTGTARERVTEWVPNRKLTFVVVEDVPAMRELSPYDRVHAPHVVGYFRTTYTSFELAPRSDGKTLVIERTSHELQLDPVLYWLPLARWVVDANNARVLAHLRAQAENTIAR